jgi:hypothetical protein
MQPQPEVVTPMSDTAQDAPAAPGGPRPRSLRIGSAAAWACCVVVIVCGAVFFAPKLPLRPLQDVVGLGGLLLSTMTVWFAVALFVCVVIGVIAAQSRSWWRLAAAVVAAVLALLVVLVPWIAAERTAAAAGDSVSWFSLSDDGPHRSPTQTTTFATVEGQALRVDVFRSR